jgi:hypothetical protein
MNRTDPKQDDNAPVEPNMTLDPPENLPTAKVGSDLVPAGEWASFISKYPFGATAIGNLLKSPLLDLLAAKPRRWEPIFRAHFARFFPPAAAMEEISASRVRIEAVTVQMVGKKENEACRGCEATGGPFVHCVRDNDTPRCGNCHWRGKPCTLEPEVAESPRRRTVLKRPPAEEIAAILEARELLREKSSVLLERLDQLFQRAGEVKDEINTMKQANLKTHIALRSSNVQLVQELEDAEDLRLSRLTWAQDPVWLEIREIQRLIAQQDRQHEALLDKLFKLSK